MPIPRNAPNPGNVCLLAEGWVVLTQPAPEVGCSSTLPLMPLDLTWPTSSSCPGPRPQPDTLVSLTLWKPPPCQGQGTKWDRAPAQHRGWGRACPPSWLVQVHTECGSAVSKSQTLPSKRKICWYVNYDETEPVSSTCILKALTPVFWCFLLTWDIKSST